MEENRVVVYCGVISALITIGDCIFQTLKKAQLTISWISYVAFSVVLLCVIINIIIKEKKLAYKIKKWIYYYSRKGEAYWIKSNESIYVFKSRTEMKHIKKASIVSNIKNLNTYCDKFKWSKEEDLSLLKMECEDENQKITVERKENWNCYTVSFDEIGKRQEEKISVVIDNLNDPEKKSLLFLSAGVACKTKELKMIVKFEDPTLVPIDICFEVFGNYFSNFPLFKENLEYDQMDHKIMIVEKKPIYGYRYLIKWKFK